jgi:hypothetical protein
MFDLQDRFDLTLPAWGPYTKAYMGISHLPALAAGASADGVRFDLAVVPGFYRRKVDVPNVMWESGYHPWEAAPDLSYYAHRHELEWRDCVYVDVSFSALPGGALEGDARLVRCHCVNTTDDPQSLVLHYLTSLHYPTLASHGREPLRAARVALPATGGVWVDGLDYTHLDLATSHPTDSLTPDGLWRGEVRGHGLVGGSALGGRFSQAAGDRAEFRFALDRPLAHAALLVRYRMRDGGRATLHLAGLVEGTVTLAGGHEPAVEVLDVGPLAAGAHALAVTCDGVAPFDLDGLALVEAEAVDAVRFPVLEPAYRPDLLPGPHERSVIVKYEHAAPHHGLAWGFERGEVREFLTRELDRFMRHNVHHHTRRVLGESADEGHYTDVFLRPIPLGPREERVLYALVCAGTREAVAARLAAFDPSPAACDAVYEAARSRRVAFPEEGPGGAYAFGQERLAATVQTNVVYPVYCRRSYIRHNTPGRWWDSLYTWDSGFIGLGLAEVDLVRAVDCLNAYVTSPGDPHAAFLHHGSPVPVQFYLFQEIWNRTQSREALAYFYPRLQQYHRFLAGRLGSSTTGALGSGLLKTWDYFYNSGGWDDYPPQVEVHRRGLEDRVTPVANTAHAIRTAKILAQMAEALGETGDLPEYRADVSAFRLALLRHAWDEESGYFGYVTHDEAGAAAGILRHESGANYDQGLDGLYPLVAGIGTDAQRAQMLGHLASRDEIFSPIGLSAVSQAAPYYRVDGYWNGTVWMAHQWFFWKALLDHGEDALAWEVAHTALEVWEREARRTYNSYEHFVIESGRGAGWHHFGGLSAPVLAWYGAHYRPGRLTGGLDLWIARQHWAEDRRTVEADLLRYPDAAGREATVLVTLAGGAECRATWEGRPAPCRALVPGCWAVRLPAEALGGTLRAEAVG